MTLNKDQDCGSSAVPSASVARFTGKVLRLKEVCKITGLGRSFVYRLQAESRYPHRIKIGVRAVGWLEDEVRKWLADKVADSRRNERDAN